MTVITELLLLYKELVDVDIVLIEELCIGGINDDWAVEEHPDAVFSSEA